MQNSKLIELFLKFSRYERTSVRKFIQSPYFNKRTDVVLLYEFIEKETRHQRSAYDKYAAWEYACPTQGYNDATMRYLMTLLLQLFERFLVDIALQKDTAQYHIYLSKAYQQLQLPKHAQQNLEQLEQHLKQSKLVQDSQYWRACYQYQQANHYFTESLKRNANRNLQALTDSLEIQFIAERLRQACELLAHETVYKIEYDKGMLQILLEYIEHQKELWLQYPAISLYYYYYQAATQTGVKSKELFTQYTQLLLHIDGEFILDEWRNLYKMAINYTIRRANIEDGVYYAQQMFVLYKSGLEKTILLENGQLSRFAYKNIVSVALNFGEYDWALQFIQIYSPLLPNLYQATYQYYALGKWYFAQKQYSLALEQLQQVQYEDIFLNLDARSTQLKIYYELNEYAALESFLQSFKMFVLRQKKILGYHYDIYKSVIQITSKLINLHRHSTKKINRLREKIKTIPTLTEREWLLAQLDKL